MTLDERFELCRSVGEECIQDEELRNLLVKKPVPVCYDGFEPSGRMHIAQGVMVRGTVITHAVSSSVLADINAMCVYAMRVVCVCVWVRCVRRFLRVILTRCVCALCVVWCVCVRKHSSTA